MQIICYLENAEIFVSFIFQVLKAINLNTGRFFRRCSEQRNCDLKMK